ncbi:MAG: polysaccharide deacetylase family protein, partial [Limisphaerales bacterium]
NRMEMERELRESKREIEDQLGTPVTSFAYPFAFPQADRIFVGRFRDALIETGYSCCLTTEVGLVHPGDDALRLKRLPVNSEDDIRLFRAKLEGGYDWLRIPQWTFKKLRISQLRRLRSYRRADKE